MEKICKQEPADQEALRLYRELHAPVPKKPPEQGKSLDKVREPPQISQSLEQEGR